MNTTPANPEATMQVSETFHPDVFAITGKGVAMPARIIETAGELVTVASPNGKQYTFHIDHILPIDAAKELLHRDRVAAVRNSYRFETLAEKPVRVVLCSHPTRRASRYALTHSPAGWLCTCPAWAKEHTCKHSQALEEMERPAEQAAEGPSALLIAELKAMGERLGLKPLTEEEKRELIEPGSW